MSEPKVYDEWTDGEDGATYRVAQHPGQAITLEVWGREVPGETAWLSRIVALEDPEDERGKWYETDQASDVEAALVRLASLAEQLREWTVASAQEILAAAGLAESQWGERIIAAERTGEGFDGADRCLALGWTTCACGELDPRIPRAEDGSPVDEELMILGILFFDGVRFDRPITAARALVAIERRAAEVLREVERG